MIFSVLPKIFVFEGSYCNDSATVKFAFYPDGEDETRVMGQISKDVLQAVLDSECCQEGLLKPCRKNFDLIASKAILRYRADCNNLIVLCADDFGPMPATLIKAAGRAQ